MEIYVQNRQKALIVDNYLDFLSVVPRRCGKSVYFRSLKLDQKSSAMQAHEVRSLVPAAT